MAGDMQQVMVISRPEARESLAAAGECAYMRAF